MKRAFIVCGAEHSGNRLVAGILASAGCAGRGSDDQPTMEDVEGWEDEQIVVIAHLEEDLRGWLSLFHQRDYSVHFILTARDPWVQVRSRSEAAQTSLEESMERYHSDYRAAFAVLSDHHECDFTVVPYESLLWKGALARFLTLFDLEKVGPLVVQGEETTIRDENGKWYAGT